MLGFRTAGRPLAGLLAALLAAGAGCVPEAPGDRPVRVLAAASLREALSAALAAIEASGGPAAVPSFAGSQTLVLQVREGVPADVVALADAQLAEMLHREGHVEPPRAFARNRLVWISALDPGGRPRLPRSALGHASGRIVLAAPSVPAGRYAREALAALGQLDAASSLLVSHEFDVRAVLARVASGEADAGVVYATDAARQPGQLHVEPLPDAVVPPIVYAAAALARSPVVDAARRLVEQLAGPAGCAALREHGFACAGEASAP